MCMSCLRFVPFYGSMRVTCVVDLVLNDVFFATKVQDIMWIMEHVHGVSRVAILVRTRSLVGWWVIRMVAWVFTHVVPWMYS